MKKTLQSILLFSFLFIIGNSFGQFQIIDYNNGNQVQGDTVVFNIYSTQNQTNYFYIKNTSTNTLDKVKITRIKITEVNGVGDYFCWGPACYPETTVSPNTSYTSPDAVTFNPGDSSLLTYDFVPHNKTGVSQYRYYVVRGGNKLDSVDVQYTSMLGLEEQTQINLSVYPNPVQNNLFLQAENADGMTVKIIDMLGNVVYTGELNSETSKIDVSQFRNGIYFVKLNNKTKAVVTKKIIINH